MNITERWRRAVEYHSDERDLRRRDRAERRAERAQARPQAHGRDAS